jgi:hypothetical protein
VITGAAFIEENPLKCEVVRRSRVEATATHLEFRLLRYFEIKRLELVIGLPNVHRRKPRAMLRSKAETGVFHAYRFKEVLLQIVPKAQASYPFDCLAGPIYTDAVFPELCLPLKLAGQIGPASP